MGILILMFLIFFPGIVVAQEFEGRENLLRESESRRSALVEGSYLESRGLFQLNQAPGSLNNQSNTAVITSTGEEGLSSLQADGFQESGNNSVILSGRSHRESLVEGSFQNAQGVFMVNQSPGNLNRQGNLFLLSLGGTPLLEEADLAAQTANQRLEYAPGSDVERKDVLRDSFSGSAGIAIISQSSGDLNIIKNTTSISFSMETLR